MPRKNRCRACCGRGGDGMACERCGAVGTPTIPCPECHTAGRTMGRRGMLSELCGTCLGEGRIEVSPGRLAEVA